MSEPYLCVVTRLRIRGPRVLPAFLRRSLRVRRAARDTSGNVRTRLLGMPPIPYYLTLTVWESEAAMHAFVTTEVHREAMAEMDRFSRTGEFVRFTSPTPKVGWRQAFRALRTPTGVYPAGRVG